MSHMGKALKISADMIQRRYDVRMLLGDKYAENVEVARRVIRGVAKDGGLTISSAALSVAKNMSASGLDPSLVIAAFVEECGA